VPGVAEMSAGSGWAGGRQGFGDVDDTFNLGDGGGGGGLPDLGSLIGLLGLAGLKGLKGLTTVGLLKAAALPLLPLLPLLPILPLLLLPLLLAPILLPLLLLLFIPIPVIAAGRRTISKDLNPTSSISIAKQTFDVLQSEACVERLACEVAKISKKAGDWFERLR
jgi:hypothetical protein